VKSSPALLPAAAAAALLLLSGAPAGAVPTATFKVSTFEDLNKGKPKGTFISSKGEVVAGRSLKQIKTKAAMVWSAVTAPDGTVYFGSGDKGLLLAVRNNKVRTVAKLKTVLVTSLALGPKGKLLAGTMPDARVLEIDPRSGKWKQLAKLKAEHIWALIFDRKRNTIYAATGSPGKIFAIPARGGKATVHYDPGEKHLLCLAREPRGTLLTGSSDKAILYRVLGKGKGVALHDFDANELRDVVVSGDGLIHVVVNKFTLKTSGLPRFDRTKEGEAGTVISLDKKTKTKSKSKVRPQELRPGAKQGKGAVYSMDPATGNVDQLLALDKGYFTDLALDASGTVWAGEGTKGKVYLIKRDRAVLTAFDVEERQVLALAVTGKEQYLGTGDAGAIYRVQPAGKRAYLSEVFDAKVPARWGSLHFQSTGALRFASRSGNTAKPDDTWTGFKPTGGVMAGVVKVNSPPGRYLQIRISWIGARTALRSYTVYYLPMNQRTRIKEITFERESDKDKKKPRTPRIKIKWKVDNPDKDPLVYRLYVREEMGLTWRKITGRDPLEKAEFEWDTEAVADGNYRVKVVASDERGNSQETTILSERISARQLVDNRKPEVQTMVVRFPWVSGLARDSYSAIRRIEFSLDSRPWRLVGPLDGIYDNPTEAFRFKLPLRLRRGAHSLAVRTVDEAGNMGVTLVPFVKQ
jgi:hypothetical protein